MENAFLVYRGRKPTEWEIIYNLDLDEQQRRDLESALAVVQVGSLDRPISDEIDSSTLGDTVCGDEDKEASVLGELVERQLSAALQEAVEGFPDALADVIRLRYQERRSIRETGKALGLTLSKVRSMEFKAKNLRKI